MTTHKEHIMTGYVIRRTDGKFVSMPGSQHSYTKSIRQARIFNTREQADGDRCVDNEYVVSVEECLAGRRRG